MAIILVLAGLILMTSGYVQNKGARSRAEAEIAAFSAALESYKADNGVYPRDAQSSDALNARASGNPSSYQLASQFLYKALSGNSTGNPAKQDAANDTKNYLGAGLKPSMLNPSTPGPNTFLQDPFGFSYGYSTIYQADLDAGTNPPTHGYNPTYDLWSTSGSTTNPGGSPDATLKWVKNW